MRNKFFLILFLFMHSQKVVAEFNFKIIKPAVIGTACFLSTIRFLDYTDSNLNQSKKEINSLIEKWQTSSYKEKIDNAFGFTLNTALSLVTFSTSLIFLVPGFYYLHEAYSETVNQLFPQPTLKDMMLSLFKNIRK